MIQLGVHPDRVGRALDEQQPPLTGLLRRQQYAQQLPSMPSPTIRIFHQTIYATLTGIHGCSQRPRLYTQLQATTTPFCLELLCFATRSVSGLSFVRDIAESIPLPAEDKLNLITRKPNQKELDRRTAEVLAKSAIYNDPSDDIYSTKRYVNSGLPVSPMVAPHRDQSSDVSLNRQSQGGYKLKRPTHARRKVFIDAAFNSSNFASTGAGLTSGLGVLKAQSYYIDRNKKGDLQGSRPTLFKGDTHTIPKFAIFSTKQTTKRHFLAPRVGAKGVF